MSLCKQEDQEREFSSSVLPFVHYILSGCPDATREQVAVAFARNERCSYALALKWVRIAFEWLEEDEH